MIKKESPMGNLKKFGNAEKDFKLLYRTVQAGVKRTLTALQLPNGCLVQTSVVKDFKTKMGAKDYKLAEGITFVPGLKIKEELKGKKVISRRLVKQ